MDVEPVQLLISLPGAGAARGAELRVADQTTFGLCYQNDIPAQGLGKGLRRETPRQVRGQIGGAERISEGIGIGFLRQGGESDEVALAGRSYDQLSAHRTLRLGPGCG